jgi:hypothetical protein
MEKSKSVPFLLSSHPHPHQLKGIVACRNENKRVASLKTNGPRKKELGYKKYSVKKAQSETTKSPAQKRQKSKSLKE